jgi:hypothetical protein
VFTIEGLSTNAVTEHDTNCSATLALLVMPDQLAIFVTTVSNYGSFIR